MTKWVTFLLLLLALLAYGLSQMRPVPDPARPASSATPDVVIVESPTPAETTEPAPEASETPGQEETPTAPAASSTPPPTNGKAPNFGPPPSSKKTPNATPKDPKDPNKPAKVDPFSPKKKAPRPVSGAIKAVILSNKAGGSAKTKFPKDTTDIYLTATPDGLNNRVEVVASYRSVMDENASFSTPVPSSGPPRRRTFRIAAPESGWAEGPYQVVFKVKDSDQVLGIDRFEITDQTAPADTPKPEYLDLVPDLVAEEPQASFTKDHKEIILRVSAQELAKGSPIRTVWSVVEVDKLTAGELVAVSMQPAPGEGKDAVFTFQAPRGGFHSGSYKVDVYFDQVPVGSQAFFVQPRTGR